MKDLWESRYAEARYAYGEAPNAFLRKEIQALDPGRMLLPAEGEGRNAVFAAQLGWTVRAFDLAAAGKEKAERLAAKHGVEIKYQVGSWQDIQVEKDWADAAALIFAHVPTEGRSEFHQKVAEGIRPGGLLFFEGFEVGQLGRDSGGPKNEAMLFTQDGLRADLDRLIEIERLETLDVELDEGPYHQGWGRVVRLVGRRK